MDMAVYLNGRRYKARAYCGTVGLVCLAGGVNDRDRAKRAKRLADLFNNDVLEARAVKRAARELRLDLAANRECLQFDAFTQQELEGGAL